MKKVLQTAIVLTVILVCCIVFAACDGETTLDNLKNEYGIVIEGGGFKEGATLVSKVIELVSEEGKNALEAIKNQEYNKDGDIHIFDISVLMDGVEVQPDGKVKVTLPAPKSDVSNYDVFHIKDGNTVEKLIATILDGKVSFETDSFSMFVLVENNEMAGFVVECTPDESGYIEYNNAKYNELNIDLKVGAEYEIKAVPNFGYIFAYWEIDGKHSSNEVCSGVIPESGLNIRAVFEPTDYYLAVKVVGNGKIHEIAVGDDLIHEEKLVTEYNKGLTGQTKITLGASADDGYKLIGWFNENNELVSAEDVYPIIVDEKIKLEARFEKATYQFKATASEGGYITENGENVDLSNGRIVDPDTQITLTAVANEGYAFDGWYRGSQCISQEASYTFTVSNNMNVEAKFTERCTITITIDPQGKGWITENEQTVDYSNGKEYLKGTAIELTAEAGKDYQFVGWYDADTQELIMEDDRLTITVESGLHIIAKFKEVPYTLALSIAGDGYIEFNESIITKKTDELVDRNDSVTLKATSRISYEFAGWYNKADSSLLSDSETYTFTMDSDKSIEARFDYTGLIGASFTASPEGSGCFEYNNVIYDEIAENWIIGTEYSVKAIPNFGYIFSHWEIGEEQIFNEVCSVTVPETGLNVRAFFSETNYYLQVKVVGNGKIQERAVGDDYIYDAEWVTEYNKGLLGQTKITLGASADDGYKFIGWFNEENECVDISDFLEINVDKKIKIEARFEKEENPEPVEVTLTATAGEGGIVTEDYLNGKKVEKGSSVTISATPNNDYYFVGWFVGETKVSDEMRYTFTINEDTILVAQFEKDAPVECTVTANAGEGGTITEGYENGKKVEKGSSVTLTATENDHYDFDGWYVGETQVSVDLNYTFTVNESLSTYAKFEEKTMYNFLAQFDPYDGGYITEDGNQVDFGNGRMVDPDTQITLTAVANEGYTFKGWGTRDDNWELSIISTDATHTFTVTENTYVQAVFAEKPNGLRIDAHNAGFTYNENGELVTTVYVIGGEIKPNIEYVGVYATYPTEDTQDVYLTLDEDYTRDLGGLDFTKEGTYTITYTYKADTSLTATLTVQVKA